MVESVNHSVDFTFVLVFSTVNGTDQTRGYLLSAAINNVFPFVKVNNSRSRVLQNLSMKTSSLVESVLRARLLVLVIKKITSGI